MAFQWSYLCHLIAAGYVKIRYGLLGGVKGTAAPDALTITYCVPLFPFPSFFFLFLERSLHQP